MSMYGTPGPVYVDLPMDVLYDKVEESSVNFPAKVEPLPPLVLNHTEVEKTLSLLKNAKTPLVIVGKGVAYGDASEEMRDFVTST